MSNKLLYIGNDTLKEVPEMKNPNDSNDITPKHLYQRQLGEYNKQLYACKEYKIVGTHSFEVGREYELDSLKFEAIHNGEWQECTKEGYDRLAYHKENHSWIRITAREPAIPLQQETDDETALLDFCHFLGNNGYKINGYDDSQLLTVIKQFLTRKTEVK